METKKYLVLIIFILLNFFIINEKIFGEIDLNSVNKSPVITVENFDCLNTHGQGQHYIFTFSLILTDYLWKNTDYVVTHRALTKLHHLESELRKAHLTKDKTRKFKMIPANYIFSGDFKSSENDISFRFKFIDVTTNKIIHSNWFNSHKSELNENCTKSLEKFCRTELKNSIPINKKRNPDKLFSGNNFIINEFISYYDNDMNFSKYLTEFFKIVISEQPEINLLYREKINLLTEEFLLKLGELSSTSYELGNILNADYLITGLTRVNTSEFTANIFIYEVYSGRLIHTFYLSGEKNKHNEMVRNIITKISREIELDKTKTITEDTFSKKLRKNEAAIEFYNAMLTYNRSRDFKHPNEFKQGVNAANNAIMLDPEYAGSYFIRGKLLGLMRKFTEAFDQYKHMIEKFPKNPWAGSACYQISVNNFFYGDITLANRYIDLMYKKYPGAFFAGVSGRGLKARILLKKGKEDEYCRYLKKTFEDNKMLEPFGQSLLRLAKYKESKGNIELARELFEECYFHYPDNKIKIYVDKYDLERLADYPENKNKYLYKLTFENEPFEKLKKYAEKLMQCSDEELSSMGYKRMYYMMEEADKSETEVIEYLSDMEKQGKCLDFVYQKRGLLKYYSINYDIEQAMKDFYKLIKINPSSRYYWKVHDIIYRYENEIKDPFREFKLAQLKSGVNKVDAAASASSLWLTVEFYYASGHYEKAYKLLKVLQEKYYDRRPYCTWALFYMAKFVRNEWVLKDKSKHERTKLWEKYTDELVSKYPEYGPSTSAANRLFYHYYNTGQKDKIIKLTKVINKFYPQLLDSYIIQNIIKDVNN